MVRIRLSSLTNAKVGQRESVGLNLGRFSLEDLSVNYLKGVLSFTRVANGILAQGTLNAAVETECTRCLELFFAPVVVEFEGLIGLAGAPLSPERPVRVTEDGWVDLSPLIREYLWLGLPASPVCSPTCAGLCPQCGENIDRGECNCGDKAPIDPRWAVLQTLLDGE
ncbi:MAG: DUF177 domain-containing protein [Anaerolineae bacterium]|nr:DUF177 domain-containing protein [Anaerolineae bacterium]